MFFSTRISHVVDELERRSELREFLGVEEVPKTACIYSFLSKFNLNSFTAMILRILNSVTRRRQRNTRLIVDCTDISVDINWFRKPVKQKDLEGKDYRWGYPAKGLFIGMKLTLVLEYPTLKPLLFLLHPANRHEAKIFEEVMNELKRRRIVRKSDVIVMDKGVLRVQKLFNGSKPLQNRSSDFSSQQLQYRQIGRNSELSLKYFRF